MTDLALDSRPLNRTRRPIDGERSDRRFYLWMAGVFVLVAFGGFIPTYWAKVAAGTFGGAPVMHIHGALFFVWTLFFFVQTALVNAGRVQNHRAWGMAGISLATAMSISVVLGVIHSMQAAQALGMLVEGRRFAIVSLGNLLMFAGFFCAAIIYVRRSAIHKRLMIAAMIPLMHAATARVFMTLFASPGQAGPPPVFVSVPPAFCVDLLLVAAMIHDWRQHGRPHPVYYICGALLLANQLLAVPISNSTAWMTVATWVQGLAG